ncbi:MAG: TonB-dependent receptor [Xanthomonadales bacterium]|jgi:hypothetical protein|nr:TonB-dependent receptor [Xanthomonadales bacterium]
MLEVIALPLLLSASAAGSGETGQEAKVLAPITVTARRVANLQPASSFASTATALRFDPQINLQTRGLPEGQADVTVRGGLFENTGFRLGAITITDPQTGHYAVEIPVDPGMLSSPELLTDFDNGLHSFNASVATVSYGFTPVSRGSSLYAGVGSDQLYHASVRTGHVRKLQGGTSFGAVISASGSSGDGTVEHGDHEFKRFSGQLQWLANGRETNVLLGYHDKFAGWPGMYTGFASLPETDQTKLGLALVNHRVSSRNGWWEVASAYRWLEDDYDFDRRTQESGTTGAFEHETRSFSLALSGMQHYAGLDWHISGQFTADRLVRSTDLTSGSFNSRSYGSLGLAPGREWILASGASTSFRAGLRADISNRDEDTLVPMFLFSYEVPRGGGLDRFDLEYSKTSQLPGYTALNSPPTGLFGGNPGLEREYANTLKFGFSHEASQWTARLSAFYRRDDGLVDWTYRQGAPYLRQANPVDMDVRGLEGFLSWRSDQLEFFGAYAWIDKDADYGDTAVDASYYALNFARHRLTLAAVYQPSRQWEIRLDNEYRVQQANTLRTSGDRAYMASLSVGWQPQSFQDFSLMLIADNLTDSDFQEFPGTPPMGRQVSLGLGLNW